MSDSGLIRLIRVLTGKPDNKPLVQVYLSAFTPCKTGVGWLGWQR